MMRGQRTRAAMISIASNAGLIVLKLVAGVITGSVAIITEAIHSAVDLVASFIAYFSIRTATRSSRTWPPPPRAC
jgi:divalent metal cation (Fe/Co/Zn/Cd) transporter